MQLSTIHTLFTPDFQLRVQAAVNMDEQFFPVSKTDNGQQVLNSAYLLMFFMFPKNMSHIMTKPAFACSSAESD